MHYSWWKTYILHPTFLQPFTSLVNSHIPLAMSNLYFSCIAASPLFPSLNPTPLYKLKWSSNNATLAHSSPYWGRMRFFYHFPSRRRSLLGYFSSLSNISTWPSFSTRISIQFSFATKSFPTCSSHSPPFSYKDNLEDPFTTTAVGPSLLPLIGISKAIPTLIPLAWISQFYFL